MKISIVTISFNQAQYLECCIRSVLDQGYEDLEYIIVDPGSTDGSREIIARYANQCTRVIWEPDHGPSDGLNKGFGAASGEVLGYLNADDIYLPGAFETVRRHFDAWPNVDVVCGRGYILDSAGNPVRRIRSDPWRLGWSKYGTWAPVQQATFFRREAFARTDGFRVDNRTCWDGEVMVDLIRSGAQIRTVRDELGGFRVHALSITGSGLLTEQYRRDRLRILGKMLGRSPTLIDRILRKLCWIEKAIIARLSSVAEFIAFDCKGR